MSGIRKPAVILADSMEEYLAPPDPYKNPPKGKPKKSFSSRFLNLNIPELSLEDVVVLRSQLEA